MGIGGPRALEPSFEGHKAQNLVCNQSFSNIFSNNFERKWSDMSKLLQMNLVNQASKIIIVKLKSMGR